MTEPHHDHILLALDHLSCGTTLGSASGMMRTFSGQSIAQPGADAMADTILSPGGVVPTR
ncbi:hypothetical protein ACFQU7_40505 [Pseudoroseomonas wenyumeiae]